MSSVKVKVRSFMVGDLVSSRSGLEKEIVVEVGTTLGQVLDWIERELGLEGEKDSVQVLLNGRNAGSRQARQTVLAEGDEVVLIPLMAGGKAGRAAYR